MMAASRRIGRDVRVTRISLSFSNGFELDGPVIFLPRSKKPSDFSIFGECLLILCLSADGGNQIRVEGCLGFAGVREDGVLG